MKRGAGPQTPGSNPRGSSVRPAHEPLIADAARTWSPLSGHPARLLALAGLTVAALLPFSGKAFHIDDPLFVWTAQHIVTQPLDPYGFDVNWYGKPMRMSEVTKNPPLTSYYIAGAVRLGVWNEWPLHIAFLIPAILVILGTYRLAERLGRRPMLASLCTLFTPVFLVSSTSVMSDTFMLAFWVWALELWISGLSERSSTRMLAASVLIGLGGLAKYFAIALIPLLVLHTWMVRRRPTWELAWLLVPSAMLGAYHAWTRALYGRGLLLDAASYASSVNGWSLQKILIGLAFTGGCLGTVWLLAACGQPRRAWIAGAAAAIMLTLAGIGIVHGRVVPQGQGNIATQALLFGVLATGGLVVLAASVLALRKGDAESWLLACWVLGTFVFAANVNWTTNGRSILPMVPAVAILILRGASPARLSSGPIAAVAASAAIALCVTWADFTQANAARSAADRIADKYSTERPRLSFEGHWGFQYYMQAHGIEPIDMSKPPTAAGDIFVVPKNNTNIVPPPQRMVTRVETIEIPSSRWITAMQPELGAGFYGDAFGPLPFSFGHVPPEQYDVFRVNP